MTDKLTSKPLTQSQITNFAFSRSLRSGLKKLFLKSPSSQYQRKVLKIWLQLSIFGLCGGILFFVWTLAGATFAIGLNSAWLSFKGLRGVLIAGAKGVAYANLIPFLAIVFFVLVESCIFLSNWIFGEKIGTRVSNLLCIILLFMLIFPLVPLSSFNDAMETQRATFLHGDSNFSRVSESILTQKGLLGEYKNQIKTTLNGIVETSTQISEIKKKLEDTLRQFEEQSAFADSTLKRVQEDLERQKLIESRITELETILNGQEPLTKSDLANTRSEGIILGILSSLLAGVISTIFSKRFRKILQKIASK